MNSKSVFTDNGDRNDGPEAYTPSDSKCGQCEKKNSACISFFAHENALMHKDTDNERAHRTTMIVCIAFVVITIIFVFAYTVRMNSFLNTINKLTADIVELAYAKGITP